MSKFLKEYIQYLVFEALDESKFEDVVKANPTLAPLLKKYFKDIQPKYLPWIIKQLKKEDIKNIHWVRSFRDLIDNFDKVVTQNKIKEKDINKYKTWNELHRFVYEALCSFTKNQVKKIHKRQTTKIYDDAEVLILEPHKRSCYSVW